MKIDTTKSIDELYAGLRLAFCRLQEDKNSMSWKCENCGDSELKHLHDGGCLRFKSGHFHSVEQQELAETERALGLVEQLKELK